MKEILLERPVTLADRGLRAINIIGTVELASRSLNYAYYENLHCKTALPDFHRPEIQARNTVVAFRRI